jgi:hypothetical protein
MTPQGRSKAGALRAAAPLREAPRAHPAAEAIAINLAAAILGVRGSEPVVAALPAGNEDTLPCGPFRPGEHRTLEGGARAWVRSLGGIDVANLQQLHAETDMAPEHDADSPHPVTVSYVALADPSQCNDRTRSMWRSWYAYFPWEDWRNGRPACLSHIIPRLHAWAAEPNKPCYSSVPDRERRVRIAFGETAGWNEEMVFERYQLLQEACLIGSGASGQAQNGGPRPAQTLASSHASILARAIGDLRRTVKFKPVVFELMQESFTLFELQRVVEAILGPHLHKQNFRRLIESCKLVEPVGEVRLRTGGRPARLFRFRPDVVLERSAPGVRLRPGRI